MDNNLNFVYSDYIVIGAGAAGLAMANLLASGGFETVLLESHSLVGGCGGYFKRSKMSFDVGATTLSGFAFNGPLSKIHETLDLQPEMINIDPGVIFSFQGQKIKRYKDLNLWKDQQRNLFPELDIDKFWNEIDALNSITWNILEDSKYFPPRNPSDLFHLGFHNTISKIKILPYVFKTLENNYKDFFHDQNFKSFINEQLLIAAQADSSEVSTLISSMALSYTNDIWYPIGGIGNYLKQFSVNLKKYQNAQLFVNTKVTEIEKHHDYFVLKTEKQVFKCRYLISTIPLWNVLKIKRNFQLEKLQKFANENEPKWGALTGYYKIKLKQQTNEIYHQVHLTERIPYTHAGSVFISLSHPEDHQRNSDGYQTLTISTHIDLKDYFFHTKNEDYANLKAMWDQNLQKTIKAYFADNLLDIINCGIGDPQTFEKYTSRYFGSVGGIPHDSKNTVLNFQKSETEVKNFYLIGDTVFPGQGIVGVIQGALNLFNRRFAL